MTFGLLKNIVGAYWMPILFGIVAAALSWLIYDFGVDTERAKWQSKHQAALIEQKQKVLELQTINRALERQRVIEAQAIKANYQEKIANEKAETNRIIGDLRNRVKRLSVPTRQAVSACNGGAGFSTPAGYASDTEARTELSESAAEFFIEYGSQADQVVIESNYVKDLLVQCHAHVDQITKLCGAH